MLRVELSSGESVAFQLTLSAHQLTGYTLESKSLNYCSLVLSFSRGTEVAILLLGQTYLLREEKGSLNAGSSFVRLHIGGGRSQEVGWKR